MFLCEDVFQYFDGRVPDAADGTVEGIQLGAVDTNHLKMAISPLVSPQTNLINVVKSKISI